MTESQIRLERKLIALGGGLFPHKQWTIEEIMEELRKCYEQPNVSSLKLHGVFKDRYPADKLVGYGFRVDINPNDPSFTIIW